MKEKLKLELILPRQDGARRARKTMVPHLGLATIAALTPDDIEVTFTDERIAEIDFSRKVDFVGISTLTTTAPRAYAIADAYAATGAKVILGGVHPSLLPLEAAQHADSVVIGEAEGIWPCVVHDLKAGRVKKFYRQETRPSPDLWPSPRREIFDAPGYYIKGLVSASRGCPFACSFCSASAFFGRTYRSRTVEAVIREIDSLENCRFLFFTDDNISCKPGFARELFDALVPCRKKWAAQASTAIARDGDLLSLAAHSGCVALFVGFESISQRSLDAMNKKGNFADEYEDAVRTIHSHGIAVHGYFMFGFDEDDAGVFKRTLQFCRRLRLDTASFAVVVPFPGTPLFDSLDREGRIVTRDWSLYDRPVFRPKQMTADNLEKMVDWAWREFYSLPSIWSRLRIRPSTLSMAYWLINLYVRYGYVPDRSRRLRATRDAEIPPVALTRPIR